MAFPKDTQVEVTGCDDISITIKVGVSGYTIDKSELAVLMGGTMDDIETLKRNIATSLVLAGVSITDDIGIKDAIEKRTFKLFR